jgi:hypothetical protein
MYQDDPLEPEGGYPPSHYNQNRSLLESPFKALETTPLLPESEMSATGEDVSEALSNGTGTYSFELPKEPKYFKVDMDKIQNLEDVKLVLSALQLACTEDMFETFKIEHLKGEPNN